MSTETPNVNRFITLDLLARHEDGYDVFDTLVVSGDAPADAVESEVVEHIRTIPGQDLDPLFVAFTGATKITSGMILAGRSKKRILQ